MDWTTYTNISSSPTQGISTHISYYDNKCHVFNRIRAPSYFVDNETPQGLMLHYRSKRRGFTTYTIGQLKAVAETYYKMEMAIEVKESEIKFDTVHVSFQV